MATTDLEVISERTQYGHRPLQQTSVRTKDILHWDLRSYRISQKSADLMNIAAEAWNKNILHCPSERRYHRDIRRFCSELLRRNNAEDLYLQRSTVFYVTVHWYTGTRVSEESATYICKEEEFLLPFRTASQPAKRYLHSHCRRRHLKSRMSNVSSFLPVV